MPSTAQPDSPADAASRAQVEVDRLLGITSGLLRTIESFNSAPTADQRQQIAWAAEDATRAIAALKGGGGKPH